jgi:histidine kinase
MKMGIWRQLRWQLVGSHMIVVVTGVLILLLMTRLMFVGGVPSQLQAGIEGLVASGEGGGGDTAVATANLLQAFQDTVLVALLFAAGGALTFGLIASTLLARAIIRPLLAMTQSSQRIANGHYSERVAVPPNSEELATVAEQFNQMAAALEHVEEQRVALIGNVSHELRTPLTALQGYIEGMADGLFPPDETTLGVMSAELHRLNKLVTELHELSRVEAGQVQLEWQLFDIVPVVGQVLVQMKPEVAARGHHVTVVGHSQPQFIYADVDRVKQILLNLVGNALRYTPSHGRVEIKLVPGREVLHIKVQDNGIGIPPASMPYLFERFYRVDQSRARKSGGSGIGLTISRHLAWAMRGDLTAASEGLGKGSTFTLTLPRQQGGEK